MNRIVKLIRKITLIGILLILVLSGCKKSPKKIAESVKKNKISKELQEILMNTNELEKQIDDIEKEKEKNPEIEIEKQKEEIIKKLEEQQGGKSEDSKKPKEEPSKLLTTQKETIYNTWKDLYKKVENIHKIWNGYEVKAMNDKADKEQIKAFEEKLNSLTISIENEDYLETLSNINSLYSSIAYFTSIYENYDSEIIQLKHDVNQVYIDGAKGRWVSIEKSMKEVNDQYKKVFKEFNRKLKESTDKKDNNKKKEELEKLKLSIESMEIALKKKDVKLLKIKRDIINNNIEKVKKQ